VPAQPTASPTGAVDLVAWAAATLAQESTGTHDLRAVGQSCLDLTAGHVPGVAGLLHHGTAALSAMLRDGESRPVHLMRVRRFRLAVADLDDRGLRGGYLVAGLVEIAEAQVPVLLKSCTVRPVGGNDAAVTLMGEWLLNPVLVDAMASIRPDGVDFTRGFSPDPSGRGHHSADREPYAALDAVGASLADLPLEVRRRLVIAPLTLDSERALEDLARVADLVREHHVLTQIIPPAAIVITDDPDAGEPAALPRPTTEPPGTDPAVAGPGVDETVGAATVVPEGAVSVTATPRRRREDAAIDPEAAAVLDAAMDEVLSVAVDCDQRESLRHVLMGRHVAVDAPPATGGTAIAIAVAVLAASTGRRCLLLTTTRTQGEAVVARLLVGGVGEVVVTGSEVTPRVARSTDRRAGDGGDQATGSATDSAVNAAVARDAAAAEFAAARQALTGSRAPWQVSRLDALNALAGFEYEPRVLTAEWPGGAAGQLPIPGATAAINAVARAVVLGAADEAAAASPWRDATLRTPTDAARAVELVKEISGALGDRVRVAIGELAAMTGTAPAITLSALRARQELFIGLQATLDRLAPEAFDIPVTDLVVATGSREFRERSATPMPPMTRRRLLARARRLVRPGVVIERDELHDLLVTAAAQRATWQQLSGGAGWAHVPADVPPRIRVITEFADACEDLSRLHPAFDADTSVDELIELATRLSAATADVAALPEVTRLGAVWTGAGLGTVVADLFERLRERAAAGGNEAVTESAGSAVVAPRDGVIVRAALWRAYWTVVAAGTAPRSAPVDVGRLLDRHELAESAYRAAASDRVHHALARAGTADHRLVRVAVPPDLADVPIDESYDVVVVDDAGEIPFAHVVAPLARAGQVVVVGDRTHARAASAWTVLSSLEPSLVVKSALRQRHRPVAVTHAAGARGDHAPAELPLVDPAGLVTFTHLPAASGLPSEGEDYVETSEVEVADVVRRAIALAETGAAADPPRSLAVVALTRTHAAAIALGVRTALRAAPERAAAFASEVVEPVVVVSADQARGIERDVVLLSVGFPRTPHGRVLHRFGPLDAEPGAGLVATAVTRARHELHVVSGLRCADLDPSRLRSAGARAVSALLVGAELAAAAAAPTAVTLPMNDADLETATRSSSASAVLLLIGQDLRERGLMASAGPAGSGITVTGPGGRLVVDLDVDLPSAAAAQARRRRLAEGGWPVVVLGVEAVAADRVGSLSAVADRVSSREPSDAAQSDPAQCDAAQSDAAQSDPAQPELEQPRLDPAGRPDSREHVLVPPARSADDSDVGWGDTPTGNDERLREDRPPHWA